MIQREVGLDPLTAVLLSDDGAMDCILYTKLLPGSEAGLAQLLGRQEVRDHLRQKMRMVNVYVSEEEVEIFKSAARQAGLQFAIERDAADDPYISKLGDPDE